MHIFEIQCSDEPNIVGKPAIAICVCAAIVCCLRYVSRITSRAGLWWDDYLLIPGLVGVPKTREVSSG